MKKKHFILFIVLLITSLGIIATWFAFATQPDNFSSAPLTTIEIPQDSINLKTIRYDEKPQAIFTLKNTGSHPLLIKTCLPPAVAPTHNGRNAPSYPDKQEKSLSRSSPTR